MTAPPSPPLRSPDFHLENPAHPAWSSDPIATPIPTTSTPLAKRAATFWLVGWAASSFAAESLAEAMAMVVTWPWLGFEMSQIMGFARLLGISATFFVAVLLGELYRQAIIAVGIVCLAAALLSNIDRSTGLVGRYLLFGVSVFATGFGLYRGAVWLATRRQGLARRS